MHARRLRPRLLEGGAREGDERRHWTLWRSEPWLALGVVAAVAGLVAFPLPPRQLDQAGQAQAAVCDPCPLPRPAADELGVADSAGSSVVAGWIRRTPDAVTGTVRVLDRKGAPARVPVELPGARTSSCGPGCRRFRLPAGATGVEVAVRERGKRYATTLPATWDGGGNARARGAAAPCGADDARAAAACASSSGSPAARARARRRSTGCARPTASPGARVAGSRAS